jgi:hypothetical protein
MIQLNPENEQILKRYQNPLKELSGLHSQLFTQLVEQQCDKLLESADKHIDEIENPVHQQVVVRDTERKV